MGSKLTSMLLGIALMLSVSLSNGQSRSFNVGAASNGYPNKAIRMVAASAPGGGIDISARVTAQQLLSTLSQPVIVDNRSGSGGLIGAEIVAKAPPDGYTLLFNGPGGSYLSALYQKLSFDPDHDLKPVALVTRQPWVIAVNPSLPVMSTSDLVQLAKSKPGQVRYGTGGVGSASHMAAELLRSAAHIDILHVPYKGTGPATLALLSGEIQFLIVGLATITQHAKTGRVRLLAVTGAARTALMPALPTMNESGVPGYAFDVWYGLFAPAGTPRSIIDKLNAEINRNIQQPDVRQRILAEGLEAVGGTSQEFERHFNAEIMKWRKVVKEAGIRAE